MILQVFRVTCKIDIIWNFTT